LLRTLTETGLLNSMETNASGIHSDQSVDSMEGSWGIEIREIRG